MKKTEIGIFVTISVMLIFLLPQNVEAITPPSSWDSYTDLEKICWKERANAIEYGKVISLKMQIFCETPTEYLKCNEGLQLIFKSSDNSPACVKSSTAEKLIEWGWTKSIKQEEKFDHDQKMNLINENTRGIYGILNKQIQWDIFSTSLDGVDKKLITSFNFTGFENARPRSILNLQPSSDGKYLLYSSPYLNNKSLWLASIDSQSEQIIVSSNENQTLREFYWSPNSDKILYHLYDVPPPCPMCGISAFNQGGPWHIYELETKQTIMLDTTNQTFSRAIGWLDSDKILFIDYWNTGRASTIYIFDVNSTNTEILYQLDKREQLDDIVVHESGNILLSILPPSFGINYNCKLLIVDSDRVINTILSEHDRICESNYNPNYWFSSDGTKLIFGKGSSPTEGEVTTTSTDKYGRYIINSIYSLDLETKTQSPVLIGKPDETTYVMGSWLESDDALAFLEFNPVDESAENYKLLISKSDGTESVEIARSDKEITFYGWIN